MRSLTDGKSTLNFIPAFNYGWKLKDYRMKIGFLLEVNYRLSCSWLSSLQQWIKTHGGRVLQKAVSPKYSWIGLHSVASYTHAPLFPQACSQCLCLSCICTAQSNTGFLIVSRFRSHWLWDRVGWEPQHNKSEAKQQAQKGITSKVSWNKNKQQINPGSDFHRLLPSPEERYKC